MCDGNGVLCDYMIDGECNVLLELRTALLLTGLGTLNVFTWILAWVFSLSSTTAIMEFSTSHPSSTSNYPLCSVLFDELLCICRIPPYRWKIALPQYNNIKTLLNRFRLLHSGNVSDISSTLTHDF